MFQDKTVILGVSGGIAAYKSCQIVRLFVKAGAHVQVIMTRAACEFITPLTLETLSGHPVTTGMFGPGRAFGTHHIELIQKADIFLIAPATANMIAKAANGIADDFLSTSVLAARCPIFFAPAMNSVMYANPATQANLAKIAEHYQIIQPAEGDLACGYQGKGRMAEPEIIFAEIKRYFSRKPVWKNKRVLITAGPTREKVDPVRFVSNFSSGKMGYALAQRAVDLGADVILISGPTNLKPPAGLMYLPVESAADMFCAVMDILPTIDVVIKAAAVSDYRPVEIQPQKIKKNQSKLHIELTKTTDILAEVKKKKQSHTLVIGFALETESEIEYAREKMVKKDLDMIVINNPMLPGAGFQTDTNIVHFLHRDATLESLPLLPKSKVAEEIFDRIEKMLVTFKQ